MAKIRLELLAEHFEDILATAGMASNIDVNANLDPRKSITHAVMQAQRIPFKRTDIDAETLSVTLEFYISVITPESTNDALAKLSTLTGALQGTLNGRSTDPTDETVHTWKFNSFLDFSAPPSPPVIDQGDYIQAVTLRGTVFVTDSAESVILSNDIVTDISHTYYGKSGDITISGAVKVLSESLGYTYIAEALTRPNDSSASTFRRSRALTHSYTLAIVNDSGITCDLLNIALGNTEDKETNRNFVITKKINGINNVPPVSKNMVLTGIQLIGAAGQFAQLQVSFQEVRGG